MDSYKAIRYAPPIAHAVEEVLAVRELVACSALARAELVAGRSGLDRPVHSVLEVDSLALGSPLQPGAIVVAVTPGVPGGGAGPALVRQLAATEAAALAVAHGYYFGSVPRPVRLAADECGLPLLRLPPGTHVRRLARELARVLGEAAPRVLRRGTRLAGELAALAVADQTLAEVLDRAGVLLGNPVAVRDRDGLLLVGESFEAALEAEIPGSAGMRLVIGSRAPLDAYDDHLAERLAGAVALVLLREGEAAAAAAGRRASLVRAALTAGAEDRDVLARGRALGVDLARPHVVLVADWRSRRPDRTGDGGAARRLATVLAAALPPGSASCESAEEIVALVPEASPADLRACVAAASAALTAERPGPPVRASWGRPAPLGGLARSHDEARRALVLATELRQGAATGYEEVAAVDGLLVALGSEGARAFADGVLGVLSRELRETLRVYLDAGLSVGVTAARLFVHPNTVRYRLARIEARTDRRLASLEDRLILEGALLSSLLASVSPGVTGAAAPRIM